MQEDSVQIWNLFYSKLKQYVEISTGGNIGSIATRLRQIALIAEDLEKARHLLVSKQPGRWTRNYQLIISLQTTILDTEVVFVDPQVAQWGLKNILGEYLKSPVVDPESDTGTVAIGGDIIEVCSPFKPDTTVGRLLEKRGDGGYMIIMQTIDAAIRRQYIESKRLGEGDLWLFAR